MTPTQRIITLSLLILVSRTTHAHARLLPGYYITNSGDSVYCNIEFGDWYKNPELIEVEVNKEKRTFKATDIKGFGAFGYTSYKTATVTYHLNPINGTELPNKFLDSTTTKTIFLKVLIKGPYSLYELETVARKYYFIQKNDNTISELLYRVAAVYGEIKEDRQYANTLAGFFLEEEILDSYKGKVYGASYNSDISSLINILNEKHGGAKPTKAAPARFQAGIYAGGMTHFFPSKTYGDNTPYCKINASSSFSTGVNVLYVTTGRLNALKVGLSVGYDSYNSTGFTVDSAVDRADPNNWHVTTYTANLSVRNKMILSNVYATYKLNPGSPIKFYLKAGFSWAIGKTNTYVLSNYTAATKGFNSGNVINYSTHGTEQVISVANELINPNFGAGIETGRHKLELDYYYPLDGGSSNDAKVFKIGMAGIFYYFTILK